MKPFAIYTAIVGNYEEIKQPAVLDERFEYILFSDTIKSTRVGVWQIRPIPYTNPLFSKIARWVKTHPELLLDGYKFSVWIDASINIKTDFIYRRVLQLYAQGVYIAAIPHPIRDCVFDELFEVFDLGLEQEKIILKWGHYLRKISYPLKNGLFETGVLFRVHNNIIKAADLLWWNCIEKYSHRDQLSFNYILWRKDICCEEFLGKGISVRNNKNFGYVSHVNSVGRIKYKNYDISMLRKVYMDYPQEKRKIADLYYRIYRYKLPILMAWLYGELYRIKFYIHKIKHIKIVSK